MAMTLRSTDEEAAREYVDRRTHTARVDGALDVLAPRCADLLDRLGKA